MKAYAHITPCTNFTDFVDDVLPMLLRASFFIAFDVRLVTKVCAARRGSPCALS
jgi:hypothetical protein